MKTRQAIAYPPALDRDSPFTEKIRPHPTNSDRCGKAKHPTSNGLSEKPYEAAGAGIVATHVPTHRYRVDPTRSDQLRPMEHPAPHLRPWIHPFSSLERQWRLKWASHLRALVVHVIPTTGRGRSPRHINTTIEQETTGCIHHHLCRPLVVVEFVILIHRPIFTRRQDHAPRGRRNKALPTRRRMGCRKGDPGQRRLRGKWAQRPAPCQGERHHADCCKPQSGRKKIFHRLARSDNGQAHEVHTTSD